MRRSFWQLRSATACRLVPNHPAQPIADTRENDDVGREHGAAQQRYLLLQRLAFGHAVGSRAQAALDEAHQRNVSQRRNDRADDGSDEPASDRSIMPLLRHFAINPPYCKTPATIATIARESGRKTFQPSRMSWS